MLDTFARKSVSAALVAVLVLVLFSGPLAVTGTASGGDATADKATTPTTTPTATDRAGSADPVPTNNGATVNFRDVRGGQPISVEIPNVASESAAVTGMEITTTFGEGSFRVEFTKPQDNPPEGTSELGPTRGRVIQYFTAEAIGLSDDRIDNVKFTFTVDSEQIPEDSSPEDVRLFRYVDGEWTTLETTHLGGDRYQATSPGFSAYAIGSQAHQAETDTETETETQTETDTATETDTETDPGTEIPDEDDRLGAVPIVGLVGLCVLLLGGFSVSRYRGGSDGTDGGDEPPVQPPLNRAENAIEQAESADDPSTAVEEYDEALDAYREALAACDPDDEQYGTVETAIAAAQRRRAIWNDRAAERRALAEQLEAAENHFQTAIAAPASNRVVIPRERYRQARDGFDEALEALDNEDGDLLGDGLTVSPSPIVEAPPTNLTAFPGVHPEAADLLETRDIDSLDAIRNADDETLANLGTHEEIGDQLAIRLRALQFWRGDEELEIIDRTAIERRRDFADEAHRIHRSG